MKKNGSPNNNNNKPRSLKEIFLEIAKPNERGVSGLVTIEQLVNIDSRFMLGNGGSWCREDGPLKNYLINKRKIGNKIIAVQLTGLREAPKERQINPKIKSEITKGRCVILDVGTNIECDHKSGRYESHEMLDINKQKLTDFQPLSKAANAAKRQHCKNCKETGKRYDAKKLGYPVGWLDGGADDWRQWGCNGCYWHDPKTFNATISLNSEHREK